MNFLIDENCSDTYPGSELSKSRTSCSWPSEPGSQTRNLRRTVLQKNRDVLLLQHGRLLRIVDIGCNCQPRVEIGLIMRVLRGCGGSGTG